MTYLENVPTLTVCFKPDWPYQKFIQFLLAKKAYFDCLPLKKLFLMVCLAGHDQQSLYYTTSLKFSFDCAPKLPTKETCNNKNYTI